MDIFVLVVSGLSAAIWTINAISAYNNTGDIDTIRTISAALWGIVFVLQAKRCRNKNRQDSDANSEHKN
jgi:hypothetical protein